MTNVQIAQKVAHMIVSVNVNAATQSALTSHTRIEEDSIAANAIGIVAGEVVARRTDPYTDKIVVKTAELIARRPKINLRRKSKES